MAKFMIVVAALMGLGAAAAVAAPAKAPANWDGLVQVSSKKLKLVYLQPGADFRGYTKVMLDPTEVAFHKDWKKNYNSSTRDLSGKVSDRDIQEAVSAGIKASNDIFAKAWRDGGYEVVTSPAPDVLRVRTGIVNISVTSPDQRTAGRSHSFSDTAGDATLIVEARNSLTGALLGRAVDRRVAGDNTTGWRSSVSNRGDFRDLVHEWANISVKGLAQLKALSPISQ